MSDCCTPQNNAIDCCAPATGQAANEAVVNLVCPQCSTKGKAVDTQTVKAQLAVSLETLRSDQYRFCATPDCPVVYYAVDADQIYIEADLRESVYQKSAGDKTTKVCYCFGITIGAVHRDQTTSGIHPAIERVNAGIQAGQCACELRNPQGSCCLGNLRALVKPITAQAFTATAFA